MIILGIILLLIGLFAKIAILWTIGIVLVLVGLVLMALGSMGRAVGGTITDCPAIRITGPSAKRDRALRSSRRRADDGAAAPAESHGESTCDHRRG